MPRSAASDLGLQTAKTYLTQYLDYYGTSDRQTPTSKFKLVVSTFLIGF